MNLLRYFVYHIKTHLIRYVHFLLAFLFIGLSSFFILPSAVSSSSNYLFYSSITEVNEIWFAKQGTQQDSYYNLNGTYFFAIGSKYISGDVLMQEENNNYEHNIFNVDYVLGEDQCLISKNLAIENNLHIGDILKSKQYSFKITNFLSPMTGIDEKYEHEGVIILSYNQKMVQNRELNHVYFCKNGETGQDVYKVVSIPALSSNYRKKATIRLLQECGAILLISLVLEIVFGWRIKKDYLIKRQFGISPKHLFFTITLDGVFKYFIPVLLMLLITLKSGLMFPKGFLLSIGIILPLSLLITFIMTLVYFLGGKKNVR